MDTEGGGEETKGGGERGSNSGSTLSLLFLQDSEVGLRELSKSPSRLIPSQTQPSPTIPHPAHSTLKAARLTPTTPQPVLRNVSVTALNSCIN